MLGKISQTKKCKYYLYMESEKQSKHNKMRNIAIDTVNKPVGSQMAVEIRRTGETD